MNARRAALPVALGGVFAAALAAVALRPAALLDRAVVPAQLAMVLAFGVAALYLVWTLPPAVTLTAGVVLSPLAGNWRLLGIPGPMSPDRIILVAGVAAVLLRAPGARDLPRPRIRPTHVLLGVLVAYTVVSAAIAGTLSERPAFFRLFDTLGVLPFFVFFVAPVVFGTERRRSVLLAGLVGLGAYLGLTALFEAARLHALIFPRFITTHAVGARAYGIFLEPVSNGAGLFVCGVAAVIAFATWRRVWARRVTAVTAALCAAGTLFTLERSVWLGAAAATVVAAVAFQHGRGWQATKAASLALAGIAIVIAGAFLLVPGLARNVHTRASDKTTVWDRKNLARAAENMIEARPLFGFGWATFEHSSLDYFQQSPNIPLNSNLAFSSTTNGTFGVHNAFLEYGATLGLVGLSLWVVGLLLAIGGAFRARGSPDLERWRLGLLPVLVFYLVIANAVPPALFPNLAVWLWLGVVWAGYNPGSANADDRSPEGTRLEWAA